MVNKATHYMYKFNYAQLWNVGYHDILIRPIDMSQVGFDTRWGG